MVIGVGVFTIEGLLLSEVINVARFKGVMEGTRIDTKTFLDEINIRLFLSGASTGVLFYFH